MQEELIKALNEIDGNLSKMEEFIFDAPFSVLKIKENLRLVKTHWALEASKQESISALGKYGINYQQSQSSSSFPTLSEKKNYYNAVLDQMERDYI